MQFIREMREHDPGIGGEKLHAMYLGAGGILRGLPPLLTKYLSTTFRI